MNPIPSLLGTTLSGRAFRIPEDLAESPTALVFGFTHEARHDVRAWKGFFTAQGIAFLSVPTTPVDVPAETLTPTMAAMRPHVPPQALDSIVMVHQGGSLLLANFGWTTEDFAKVLMLEKGRVCAIHGEGPFGDAAAEIFRPTSEGFRAS